MAQDLEEELLKSEQARKKVLEKVDLVKSGESLPGSLKATLQEVEEIKATFGYVLEAKAFRRLSQLLDVIQTRVEATEELRAFSVEIDGLTKALNTMMMSVEGSHSMLVSLDKRLTVEFEERRKHRQKVQATLSILDEYLKNWV